jgi:hypothetical protein
VIQFLFHYAFFNNYWYHIPHDGKRYLNSQAQRDIIDLAVQLGQIVDPATETGEGMDELRAALAGEIWRREQVYAVWALIFGFFLKVSFTNHLCRLLLMKWLTTSF